MVEGAGVICAPPPPVAGSRGVGNKLLAPPPETEPDVKPMEEEFCIWFSGTLFGCCTPKGLLFADG